MLFSIFPFRYITSSFPHKIAMDFTIINENLEKWKANLDQMETALIERRSRGAFGPALFLAGE